MNREKITSLSENNVRPFLDKDARANLEKISDFWNLEGDDEDHELERLLPDEAFGILSIDELEDRAKIALGEDFVERARTFAAIRNQTSFSKLHFLRFPLVALGAVAAIAGVALILFGAAQVEEEILVTSVDQSLGVNGIPPSHIANLDGPIEELGFSAHGVDSTIPPPKPQIDELGEVIDKFREILSADKVIDVLNENGWRKFHGDDENHKLFFQIRLTEDAKGAFNAGNNIGLSGNDNTAITEAIRSSKLINDRRMRVGDSIYGYFGSANRVKLFYVPRYPSRMLDYWNIDPSSACSGPVVISSKDELVPRFGSFLKKVGRLDQIAPCQPDGGGGEVAMVSYVVKTSANK
ncbi:MAG: hypothetical protein AAGA08_20690 [Pseudomonadota bacterium]